MTVRSPQPMDLSAITVQLSDCCELYIGRNIDNSKLNKTGVGVPYIVGASDMMLGRFVPHRFCASEIRNPVYSEEGDLLVSVVGTLGKMAINTVGRAILSRHICAIRIKENVSRHYVMAMVSRLILEAIPDTSGFVMGFQAKLDVEDLKKISFALPSLVVQDWLTARLTSIASIIMAASDTPDIYSSPDLMAAAIEKVRSEQRARMQQMADALAKMKELLETLPQDSGTACIVSETESTMKRLLNIR